MVRRSRSVVGPETPRAPRSVGYFPRRARASCRSRCRGRPFQLNAFENPPCTPPSFRSTPTYSSGAIRRSASLVPPNYTDDARETKSRFAAEVVIGAPARCGGAAGWQTRAGRVAGRLAAIPLTSATVCSAPVLISVPSMGPGGRELEGAVGDSTDHVVLNLSSQPTGICASQHPRRDRGSLAGGSATWSGLAVYGLDGTTPVAVLRGVYRDDRCAGWDSRLEGVPGRSPGLLAFNCAAICRQ
jgi:hypothetical protein